jgi:hypothetical protein
MHVFLIGGITVPKDAPEAVGESERLHEYANRLGAALARNGHTLVVCSPFAGSFDHEALIGAATVANDGPPTRIEFHYLNIPSARAELLSLERRLANLKISAFHYPSPPIDDRKTGIGEALSVAWLLPQIRAMDRSHLTIALGGRNEGSANMLLHLASARKKALLPLPLLGGAASHAFERHSNELAEDWGNDFWMLKDPTRLEDVVEHLETVLADKDSRTSGSSSQRSWRFFISYPRARPAEADFVEALLRRQSEFVEIVRDEREFEAGHEIQAQIRHGIFGADVFVALWCREYACSPWCCDELETALEREKSGLKLWILLIDDTRMVPKGARALLHLSARSREEIESKLIAQLTRLLGHVDTNS